MKKVDWNLISSILEDKLNIPKRILDYISVRDITLLCASGTSNQDIALFLDTEEEFVLSAIEETLLFSGWEKNLDINPYAILKNILNLGYEAPYSKFLLEVNTITPYYSDEEITRMYTVARKYLDIEVETEKYWT